MPSTTIRILAILCTAVTGAGAQTSPGHLDFTGLLRPIYSLNKERVVLVVAFRSDYGVYHETHAVQKGQARIPGRDVLMAQTALYGQGTLQIRGNFTAVREINGRVPRLGHVDKTFKVDVHRGTDETDLRLSPLLAAVTPDALPLKNGLALERKTTLFLATGEPGHDILGFQFVGPVPPGDVPALSDFFAFLLRHPAKKSTPAHKRLTIDEARGLLDSDNPYLVLLALHCLKFDKQFAAKDYFRSARSFPADDSAELVQALFEAEPIRGLMDRTRRPRYRVDFLEGLGAFVTDARPEAQLPFFAEFNRLAADPLQLGARDTLREVGAAEIRAAISPAIRLRTGQAGWAEVVARYRELDAILTGIADDPGHADGVKPPQNPR